MADQQVEQLERQLEIAELTAQLQDANLDRFERLAKLCGTRRDAAVWAVEMLCRNDRENAAARLAKINEVMRKNDGDSAVLRFIQMKRIELSGPGPGEENLYESLIVSPPERRTSEPGFF